MLNTEPLFYIMVEIIKHREGYELRYLRAEPEPNISERVHNLASTGGYFSIRYPLADSSFRYIVPYTREIMVYIAFQHPTVRAALDTVPP